MRSPSTILLNLTATIYQEINGFDTINAPVKNRGLLYSNVPIRHKHLSASEVNADGSERARETHRFYIPYSGYPLITEADRLVLSDGTEWDIYHSDNVDSQNIFWEMDGRLADNGNAEIEWTINPIGPELSITADILNVGTFTGNGLLSCVVNQISINQFVPIYNGPGSGSADPLNIFYGVQRNTGAFAKIFYVSILINNVEYWIPVYSWDGVYSASSSNIIGTVAFDGVFTSQGFVKIYVNSTFNEAWLPIYSRTV